MNGFPDSDSGRGDDPFTKYWSDMMSKMSAGAWSGKPEQPQEAAMKAMRQAFFDAWAKSSEEFMRSEIFLEMMKKSMDASLAFKEQLNKYLVGALQDSQMPTRSDTDTILQVLRSLEERVLERIDDLTQRIRNLEAKAAVKERVATEARSPEAPKGKRS